LSSTVNKSADLVPLGAFLLQRLDNLCLLFI